MNLPRELLFDKKLAPALITFMRLEALGPLDPLPTLELCDLLQVSRSTLYAHFAALQSHHLIDYTTNDQGMFVQVVRPEFRTEDPEFRTESRISDGEEIEPVDKSVEKSSLRPEFRTESRISDGEEIEPVDKSVEKSSLRPEFRTESRVSDGESNILDREETKNHKIAGAEGPKPPDLGDASRNPDSRTGERSKKKKLINKYINNLNTSSSLTGDESKTPDGDILRLSPMTVKRLSSFGVFAEKIIDIDSTDWTDEQILAEMQRLIRDQKPVREKAALLVHRICNSSPPASREEMDRLKWAHA
jgi:hypothetical protein